MPFISCTQHPARYAPFLKIVLTLALLAVSSVAIAKVSRSDLTAAYIFRLSENIQWYHAADISRYRFHLIDSSKDISQSLKQIARKSKLHGKSFTVTHSRTSDIPKGVHIVYLARSKASEFNQILRQTEGKNILLISDHISNQRQIMINLFESGSSRLKFEINKANILNQNLGVNPDIILLGGTEIDVAKLYREGQNQLRSLERQVRELDSRRQKFQESAVKSEREAAALARELKSQKKALQAEQQKLKQAESQTKAHQAELVQQRKLIAEQKSAVDKVRASLEKAQVQYQQQQQKLVSQEQLITQQNSTILKEQTRIKAAEKQTQALKVFIMNQKQQVEAKLAKYEELNQKVEQQELALVSQQSKIQERASTIREQDETIARQLLLLDQQSDVIGTQKDYLQAMGLAFLFGALLVIVILLNIRAKKRINTRLTEQNTKLEETTSQLFTAKKAAEKANRAKTAFLTTMSHELRTPLNAILGFSQLMQRDPAMPASQKEKLHIINSSGEHLLGLINDVLEVSKIEAGRITLSSGTFDLHALLTGIEAIFKGRLEDKDVQLIFEEDDDLPHYITTDQSKVRQVLINLLGNAVKFTSKGSITLKASMQGIEHSQENETKLRLGFEVTDTGVGIAQNDYDKIFAPFEQAEDGARKEGSTGLGLSISRRYAQLMGGDLTFESEPGKGSSFYFEINAVQGKSEDEESRPVLPTVVSLAPNQEEVRALVVDDNDSNRLLLSKILSSTGFKVREAENGKVAMDIFSQWQPDFLLLDVRMPVMDGAEVTRRIRAMETGKETVIIIVSASVFEEQKTQLLELGANAFLRKPVRENLLFTEIRQQLGIEYLYREHPEEPHQDKLSRAELQELPESLLKALSDALTVGDIEELKALCTRVSEHNSTTGEALRTLVDHFDLNHIQELLDKPQK
ncbi:YfiR/HmsC family protein [Vibrio sp. JC009]|uniref:YfiR/HmsC family protein n=1 Tax=Vibrio sp. JC009 TaxID=2912314 RepID=UPI0023AF7298|nr:YfiR/HmsC family protein [Vibrio sp. JC009]WED20792.1 YfiR/HmsC family protein [Vibrio sp. JC009]